MDVQQECRIKHVCIKSSLSSTMDLKIEEEAFVDLATY